MSINDQYANNNPFGNALLGGGGAVGISGISGTTILGGQNYPGMVDVYARQYADQLRRLEELSRKDTMNFSVKKIANGYILTTNGTDYYCEGMDDVGKRVTAEMVKGFLNSPDVAKREQDANTAYSIQVMR